MSRSVEITVTSTIPGLLPPGVSQGLTKFTLFSAVVPPVVIATQLVTGLRALFTGVANGDYTAEVQVLDTWGNTLGVPVNQPLIVADLLFQQPAGSLSVVVS